MPTLLLFPRDDPAQIIRARYTLMAVVSYLTISLFVLYCGYTGLFRLPNSATFTAAGLALAINLGFYLAICNGWNKRFRDPNMTLAQITVSTVWLMFVLLFIEQLRGAVLTLFLITFGFSIFRLRTPQFIGSAVFALSGYGAVIALLAIYHPETIDLRIEILQWILLAMVLIWFAVIGRHNNRIRDALREKNSELKKALATIERLASHDELTGIHNRRFFLSMLHQEESRAVRVGQPFCLALLDLDSFKAINDRFGHLAGDDVLRTFAQCVQKEVRQVDYFARYGGEEFALLLIGADMALASNILERIRGHIERTHFPHVDQQVTVSIGIAQHKGGESITDLISRADTALYAAKHAGRNCVQLAAA